MKKIVLHRADVDNAGAFADAGTELTIGEKSTAGTITAARAKDLVAGGAAVSATAAAADEKAAEAASQDPR